MAKDPSSRNRLRKAVECTPVHKPTSKFYSKFSPDYLKKRNAERKQAYGSNARYRQQAQGWSRNCYRRKNGVILRDCSGNLGGEKEFGEIRTVVWKGKKKQMLSFSSQQMADLLGGYSIQNFYQWLSKRLLPRPIIPVDRTKQPLNVYMLDEVKVIVRIVAEHQKTKAYLTAKDRVVTRSLFNMVNAVRVKHGLPKDTTFQQDETSTN